MEIARRIAESSSTDEGGPTSAVTPAGPEIPLARSGIPVSKLTPLGLRPDHRSRHIDHRARRGRRNPDRRHRSLARQSDRVRPWRFRDTRGHHCPPVRRGRDNIGSHQGKPATVASQASVILQGRESVRLTTDTCLPSGDISVTPPGPEHWPYKPRNNVGAGLPSGPRTRTGARRSWHGMQGTDRRPAPG